MFISTNQRIATDLDTKCVQNARGAIKAKVVNMRVKDFSKFANIFASHRCVYSNFPNGILS